MRLHEPDGYQCRSAASSRPSPEARLPDRQLLERFTFYAGICGWPLARAHARAGDPIAIAGYLGNGDAFDRSITDFSRRYADQNERDYGEFVQAVRSGRLEAQEGI